MQYVLRQIRTHWSEQPTAVQRQLAEKNPLVEICFTQLYTLICKITEFLSLSYRSCLFRHLCHTLRTALLFFFPFSFPNAWSPVCSICLFWVTFALSFTPLIISHRFSVPYLLCFHPSPELVQDKCISAQEGRDGRRLSKMPAGPSIDLGAPTEKVCAAGGTAAACAASRARGFVVTVQRSG